MKIIQESELHAFLKKIQKPNLAIEKAASSIIKDVKKNGDDALIFYSNKFDGADFKSAQDFTVSKKEFESAEKSLDKELKEALKLAAKRIFDYHKKQLPKDFHFTDKDDVTLGNIWRPIESIGVYAPGGSASYPSSVLMCAVPAIASGVKNISICSPSASGKINPAVIFAAKLCSVEKIYKVGGAQAISALAYGTNSISKVNKIVGPGNAYVAAAKKLLFGEVGIDMIAGPTDVLIVAEKNNKADWIAADALSQAEHGPDSRAIVIVDDLNFAKEIQNSVFELSKKLSRKKIIAKSLKNSAILVINNLENSPSIINLIAPEHLEIITKNPQKILSKTQNAGAIFLGHYTPEAIGDYIAGPSHTLPTNATAKFSSGLSVYDFIKRMSLISCSKKSFLHLAKHTSLLAKAEGLDAHKLSIDIRTK